MMDEIERKMIENRRKAKIKLHRERPGLVFRIHSAWTFLAPQLPGANLNLYWGSQGAEDVVEMDMAITINGEEYIGTQKILLSAFDQLDHCDQEALIREKLQFHRRCLINTIREAGTDSGPGGERS